METKCTTISPLLLPGFFSYLFGWGSIVLSSLCTCFQARKYSCKSAYSLLCVICSESYSGHIELYLFLTLFSIFKQLRVSTLGLVERWCPTIFQGHVETPWVCYEHKKNQGLVPRSRIQGHSFSFVCTRLNLTGLQFCFKIIYRYLYHCCYCRACLFNFRCEILLKHEISRFDFSTSSTQAQWLRKPGKHGANILYDFRQEHCL